MTDPIYGLIKAFRKSQRWSPDLKAMWGTSRDAVALLSLYAFTNDKQGLVRAATPCVMIAIEGCPNSDPRAIAAVTWAKSWLEGNVEEGSGQAIAANALAAWNEIESAMDDAGEEEKGFASRDLYVARSTFWLATTAAGGTLDDLCAGIGHQQPASIRAPAARCVDAAGFAEAAPEQALADSASTRDYLGAENAFRARYAEVQSQFAAMVRAHVECPSFAP
jgi:hypothetical protein